MLTLLFVYILLYSSRLNNKETDQFNFINLINKTMFHSFELIQTEKDFIQLMISFDLV